MESYSAVPPYDNFYFAHDCGRPYQRDEVWLHFFAAIADRVVSDIRPCTVLDAGCAMGFLVEALRDWGVDAVGVDISEYAIQQVRADIRPSCWIGSVIDPFPQKYDLIVCIEVLEHLSPSEAEQAVANFCQHTDDVLFSSTPFDYKEVTHLNVRPPDYWAELFARHGFFHDVDFDASFISHWAARFRRTRDPVTCVVAAYERRLWRLEQDNHARRELTLEQRNELAKKDQEVQVLRTEMGEKAQQAQMLQAELTEKEQQVQTSQIEMGEKAQQAQMLQAELIEKERQVQTSQIEMAGKTQEVWALQAQVEEKTQALHSQEMEKEHAVQALRAEAAEREQALKAEIADKERSAQTLRVEVAERERRVQTLIPQLSDLRHRLSLIEVDYGWRLLQKVKKVRLRLAPRGSKRERWFLRGLRFVSLGQSGGQGSRLRRRGRINFSVGLGSIFRRKKRADFSIPNPTKQKEPLQMAVPGASAVLSVPAEQRAVGGASLNHAPGVSAVSSAPAVPHEWGNQILVISGSTGSMERFRCHHLCEQLHLAGVGCEVRSISDPDLLSLLPQYKLVILHRAAYDHRVAQLVVTAHKTNNAIVLFDIDDLVFQLELDVWIRATETMSPADKGLFRDGLWRYRRTLKICDGVLAASEIIADAARHLGKPAWVHRNALSLELLALSEQAYQQRVPSEGKVVIGYASGTRTHNWDFAEAEPGLERILQTYPQTELWIIGYLDLGPRWERWDGRIKRVPFMPWNELPRALAALDINLAPLEMHNPFCNAKSELKYLEAAAVGVPSVASRWGAFSIVIRDGETGFLANTPAEWYDALERLVTDQTLRRAIGERARTEILRRYTPTAKGQELLATLDTIAKSLPNQKGAVEDGGLSAIGLDEPIRLPEHALAHQLLDGLKGLEIGAAAHNPFGLNTRNVAPEEDVQYYDTEEGRKYGMKPVPLDIVAFADDIPVPNESEDFIVSSHIIEHVPNLIKTFVEWDRIVRDGGYVLMIVPLKGAWPPDAERELTPLEHFLADYRDEMTIDAHPIDGVPGGKMGHYHTFTPDSLFEVVEWMKNTGLCHWELVAREDVDTKVGNGFTLAFRVHHRSDARTHQAQN